MKRRKIITSLSERSDREMLLADLFESKGEPKAMSIVPLNCFHLVEALLYGGASAEAVENAAIESIYALKGRVEILERMLKDGKRTTKIKPSEKKAEEIEVKSELVELEINEEDFA